MKFLCRWRCYFRQYNPLNYIILTLIWSFMCAVCLPVWTNWWPAHTSCKTQLQLHFPAPFSLFMYFALITFSLLFSPGTSPILCLCTEWRWLKIDEKTATDNPTAFNLILFAYEISQLFNRVVLLIIPLCFQLHHAAAGFARKTPEYSSMLSIKLYFFLPWLEAFFVLTWVCSC